MPLPFSTTSSRSHLLDTNWLTVGVSEQVIGMGAEADGLAAGAGLAMTTAGWGTAGVGWMGCIYKKRANKPLMPTCPHQGVRVPSWTRGRAKMGMNLHSPSTLLPVFHQKAKLKATYQHPPNDNDLQNKHSNLSRQAKVS